jgi:RES domain-containing protein
VGSGTRLQRTELLERIDRIPPVAFEGNVVRHIAPGYLPLSGEGARIHGGRWNPPDSFATLYTALSRETMIDELDRAARRQGLTVADLLPRVEVRYRVSLQRLLDLRDADSLVRVGLVPDDVTSDDWTACQGVGEAAHRAGFEGILAPSAAAGEVLVLFLDQIQRGSTVKVRSTRPLSPERVPPRRLD